MFELEKIFYRDRPSVGAVAKLQRKCTEADSEEDVEYFQCELIDTWNMSQNSTKIIV